MITKIVALVVLSASASVCLAAEAPKVTAAGITLKTVATTFPPSDTVFTGANAEAINNNCLTCHSTSMVLNQPPLSKTTWGEEVAKMRKAYGAPVPDDAVASIIDYLVAMKPGS